jgi:hypothetical protein
MKNNNLKIKGQSYVDIVRKDSISFNEFMGELKDFRDAEKILAYLLATCDKYKNKTRIQRVYHRFCVLRRNNELEMITNRSWYPVVKVKEKK